MVVSQENWLALWMRMGVWARTVEPFQATLSLSTEERSLGVPRGRKSFPCRLPKASTLLLPTQLKKLSGSVNSSFNSSVFFFLRHPFSATINLPSRHQYHARTKHIDVRFHFIRWIIEDGKLRLIYCPTDEMVADVLTTALVSTKVKHFASELGLVPL